MAVQGATGGLVAASAAPGDGVVVLSGRGVVPRVAGCMAPGTPDFVDAVAERGRRVAPADCAEVMAVPPILVWPEPRRQEPGRSPTLLRDRSQPFQITVRRGDQIVHRARSSMTSWTSAGDAASWRSGTYTWTVAYTSNAVETVTSRPRRFVVPARVASLDWPDGEQLARSVAARRSPRVLPPGATFRGLHDAARVRDYGGAMAALVAFAAKYADLQSEPPLAEPALPRLQQRSTPSIKAGVDLQNKAGMERVAIRALMYAYKFTERAEFRVAALARLDALAGWAADGESVRNLDFDYVNRDIYRALAEGLDLFADECTPEQRRRWAEAVSLRMRRMFEWFEMYDVAPYESHLISETAIALESLLHIAGIPEIPDARRRLAQTWERFRAGFNVWGDQDGGFADSVAYGWYSLDPLTNAAAALRVIAGVDISRHPYMRRLGQFMIGMTPPSMAGAMQAFGDGSENTMLFPWNVADGFRLYARLVDDPAYAWYWRANPVTLRAEGGLRVSPWHFMLLGLPAPATRPAAPVASAYLSTDAGIAALHSRVADPQRSMLALRASRFGSISHSHADQNAIVFDSRGHNMLVTGGYYPYYSSPHHYGVTRATRFKNALTFDGGIGQAEPVDDPAAEPEQPGPPALSMDAAGAIINFHNGPRWGVVTGDAGAAYRTVPRSGAPGRPMLEAAIRSAAYERVQGVALIYDHAVSARPRRWELNFHALAPFEQDGPDGLRVDRKPASICMQVHGPSLDVELTRGFPIPPEAAYPSEKLPEQHHARFAVEQRSKSFTAVTVIREDCADVPVKVRLRDGRAEVTVGSQPPIVFDGRSVRLRD